MATDAPTTGAPSGASAKPSRRNLLGAIAGVPLAATFGTIALPAMASDNDVLQRLIESRDDAEAAFNNTMHRDVSDEEYDRLEGQYLNSLNALDGYEPQTAHEFVRAVAARYQDGDSIPTEYQMDRLLEIARRLAGEGR